MADTLSEAHASSLESDYITPEINDEISALAEREQQVEIVALNETDGQWKLELGDGFEKQWETITAAFATATREDQERASISSVVSSIGESSDFTEDKVFVISLLGNKSSGKSYVARYLHQDSSSDGTMTNGPTSIDEEDKKGATTENINCHVSKSEFNQKTLVLEYEGEKGAGFSLFYYARRGLAHIPRTTEKAQRRRQAVTDYFPKVAYILSDVVILLGNDDLASTDYLTRCREFTVKANDGVSQMVHRPVLIIIQNKASLAQSQHYEVITKSFFEIHGEEAATLRPFYSDIKCFVCRIENKCNVRETVS